jgi:hypothetical protein
MSVHWYRSSGQNSDRESIRYIFSASCVDAAWVVLAAVVDLEESQGGAEGQDRPEHGSGEQAEGGQGSEGAARAGREAAGQDRGGAQAATGREATPGHAERGDGGRGAALPCLLQVGASGEPAGAPRHARGGHGEQDHAQRGEEADGADAVVLQRGWHGWRTRRLGLGRRGGRRRHGGLSTVLGCGAEETAVERYRAGTAQKGTVNAFFFLSVTQTTFNHGARCICW